MQKQYSIYLLYCHTTKKKYVGSTGDLKARVAVHESSCKHGRSCSSSEVVRGRSFAVLVLEEANRFRNAFADAMARYETMWHGNFQWTIDEAAQRVAASFDVRLVDKAGKEIELSNVKLFQVKDGRFTRLDLYFSTTEAIVAKPS